MSNPGEVWLSKLSKVVAGYGKRIDLLERAVKKQGVASGAKVLARLNDVFGVTYDPPESRPTHGSVLAFLRDIDSAIGGGWTYRGGAAHRSTFIYSGTGTSPHSETLVDTETWDEATPYVVVVQASASSPPDGFPTVPAPGGTTLALTPDTDDLSVLVDSVGATLNFDGATLSFVVPDAWNEAFQVNYPHPKILGNVTASAVSELWPITWDLTLGTAPGMAMVFSGGTPVLNIIVGDLDTDAYPNSVSLSVLTTVIPLTALTEAP